MKVCIIGLGYIGFPTACVVAKAGHEVIGVDINAEIIDKLNHGELHIVNEDGLADIAREVSESGRLRVTTKPELADVFIIAVPTPYRKLVRNKHPEADRQVAASAESGISAFEGDDARFGYTRLTRKDSVSRPGTSMALSKDASVSANMELDGIQFGADLSFVQAAVQEIIPYVRAGNLVVLESTVSPGTTKGIVCTLLEKGTNLACGTDVYVAHAPERVLPGRIVKELTENDRVVGGINEESTNRAVAFYQTFVRGRVVGTDSTTAEMVKLMENTFRDVNIALANEFALICEEVGIDVYEAITLANRHPRVNILKPGPGVGGHCIAVDPYFIVEVAPKKAKLIALAREINSSMPYHVANKVRSINQEATKLGKPIKKVIALGAAYKPNVGDERESPALHVAELLQSMGYEVEVHDPYIPRFAVKALDSLVVGADLLLMLTDHEIYRHMLKPDPLRRQMRQTWVLDTRGFFGPEWDAQGFQVVRLGVGKRWRT